MLYGLYQSVFAVHQQHKEQKNDYEKFEGKVLVYIKVHTGEKYIISGELLDLNANYEDLQISTVSGKQVKNIQDWNEVYLYSVTDIFEIIRFYQEGEDFRIIEENSTNFYDVVSLDSAEDEPEKSSIGERIHQWIYDYF